MIPKKYTINFRKTTKERKENKNKTCLGRFQDCGGGDRGVKEILRTASKKMF